MFTCYVILQLHSPGASFFRSVLLDFYIRARPCDTMTVCL